MLPKLEEETETLSGMRHKRRQGEGRTALGVGAEVEGSRQGKQAVCAGVDENRRRFI